MCHDRKAAAASRHRPTPSKTAKLVLARPAAVTHGWDSNQRVVELPFTNTPGSPYHTITFDAPAANQDWLVPRGHYMLFLVTDEGVPCERAGWVFLE